MLPDFPKLTNEMDDWLTRFLQKRALIHSGVVREIPRHAIHEGQTNSIVRPDGSEDVTDMVHLEETMEIGWDELASYGLVDTLQQLDEVAKKMAEQQSKHVFKTLHKATEESGNVIDGKGRPMSVELLLDVLEKMHVDFDQDGQMSEINAVIGPSQMEALQKSIADFENNEELKKREQEILMRKREEWRAREAARTLVG